LTGKWVRGDSLVIMKPDGVVNTAALLFLLGNWGESP